MKKALRFFLCVLLGGALYIQAGAQGNRYEDRVFSDINVTNGVVYSNAPALNNNLADFVALFGMSIPDYNIHIGENSTANIDLAMDIYTPPASDTVNKRPAIIFVHGGSYLFGSRQSDDMVALCDSFAHLGYVTSSIDYRMGIGCKFDVVLIPALSTTVTISGENSVRAGYRAIQDLNAATSFLRANAETYSIDPERIYIIGSDAGANTVLSSVYLDKTSEIPDAVRAFDDGGDLGDFNKYITDGYAPKGTGAVSLWGAMVSTSIIDDDATPMFLMHGTDDTLVNFKMGYPMAGSASNEEGSEVVISIPETYGSYCIDTALTNRGISHETYFPEGVGHEFYGTSLGMFTEDGPNAYWDTVYTEMKDFLHGLLGPDTDFEYFRKGLSVDLRTFDSYGSGNEKITWTVDGNVYKDVTRVNYTASGEGTIEVTLSITLQDGFTSSVTKQIALWYNVGDFDPEVTMNPDENHTIYVREDGTGDGSSWDNALNGFYLQNALFSEGVDIVMIGSGVYYPVYSVSGNNENLTNKTFLINTTKKVLGSRYLEINTRKTSVPDYSILSGDLGMIADPADNVTHVITCVNSAVSVQLDSLYILGGNAVNTEENKGMLGGGILASCGIDLTNSILENNFAGLNGGAVHTGNRFDVYNTVFRSNEAGGEGGALYLSGNNAGIDNCLFISNLSASRGGAVYADGSVTKISSTTLVKNSATVEGGAFFLANNTSLSVDNSVLWNNTGADGLPDQLANNSSSYTVSYSAFEGGIDGTEVINLSGDNEGSESVSYPYFVNPGADDYHLGASSSLINKGSSELVKRMYDLDGLPRISDGYTDIGAFEYQQGTVSYRIIFAGSEYCTMDKDTVFVEAGSNAEAVITVAEGYNFTAFINGSEMNPAFITDNNDGSFALRFENVTDNLLVNFTFAIKVLTITATTNEGGFITPNSISVNYGQSAKFMIVPDQDVEITSVLFNDTEMLDDIVKEGGHYNLIFAEVKTGGSVSVTFTKPQSAATRSTDKLTIWPNPADVWLSISLENRSVDAELTITNLYGQVLIKKEHFSAEGLDVSTLEGGCYIITLRDDEKISSGVFMKK